MITINAGDGVTTSTAGGGNGGHRCRCHQHSVCSMNSDLERFGVMTNLPLAVNAIRHAAPSTPSILSPIVNHDSDHTTRVNPWYLSRIDRFSLGPIEEGSKRGRDGSRGGRDSS